LFILFAMNYCSAVLTKNETYEDTLRTALANYEKGAYIKSMRELESMTHIDNPDLLVYVYTYIALNQLAIGDKASAIESFKNAISINPALELDPIIATPEVMAVLEDAKSEKAYESAGCSCFIPGIGQFMKGEDNKARALIAASGITLTATIITWTVADSKHNHYLSLGPEDIDEMDAAYNDYNHWNKLRIIAATTFVGIYVYNILDAIFSRNPEHSSDRGKLGFNINPGKKSISVSYEIKL
jgi:tetratricopeptide (TPR) repeat protein